MKDAPFDITDGRNRYRPCAACHADHGMGLTSRPCRQEGDKPINERSSVLFVECGFCGHRGPQIMMAPAVDTADAIRERMELDRKAFEAWNAEIRQEMPLII